MEIWVVRDRRQSSASIIALTNCKQIKSNAGGGSNLLVFAFIVAFVVIALVVVVTQTYSHNLVRDDKRGL